MLGYKEMLMLGGLTGSTSLFAIIALWFNPHLWRAGLGILATGGGLLLYFPLRIAYHPRDDAFRLASELFVVGGLLGVWNLALVLILLLLTIETILERRNAQSSLIPGEDERSEKIR